MRIPIRVRLTAVYCVVFGCSALLLEIGAYWGVRAAIYAIVDHDLQVRSLGVEEFLNEHIARKSLPRLQEELRQHVALQPAYLAILETSGSQIFRGQVFSRRLPVAKHGAGVWTVNGNPESIRILAMRRKIQGREYDLFLATGLTVPLDIMSRARLMLSLTSPLVLLFAALTGYWIAGRALAPVSELTRTARSIGAGDLARRIAVPNSGDELQELAVTLNDMLARIDSGFRQVAQFTANASHELRTPLALIRTTSEVALLRKSATAGTYRDALHRILSEAERNTALLDNLLLLARADSRGRALDRHPVNLSEEIHWACEQMQVLASEKNLNLLIESDDQEVWILANTDHLRRLWMILLDNAVKYTAPGGEVRVVLNCSHPGFASVDVIDRGIGIDEHDLPHIFERFFRADEARTRGVGGTGLGLSIARWITEAHDATIAVESTLGRGSVFRVVFPRVAGSKSADAIERNAASSTEPSRTLTV